MLPVPQLVTKFLTFCGTQKFSTVCTTARHLSQSWARCPPIMCPKSHVNIMLPPMPRLWSGLLPSGLLTKTMLYPFLFSPMHATCRTPHPSSFDQAHFLLHITSLTHTHTYECIMTAPIRDWTRNCFAMRAPPSIHTSSISPDSVCGRASSYSTFIFRVSLNCLTLNIRAQNSYQTSETTHSMPKHHTSKDSSTAVRCSNLEGEVNFVLQTIL